MSSRGCRLNTPRGDSQSQEQKLSKTFVELGVAPPIVEALDARGIDQAFPIQEMTIADALAGRDVCGKAKTGSGKTLAFGIPAVQLLSTLEKGQVASVILVPHP